MRHSISKMAGLHFTSHEQYTQRIIRLGENPTSVFTVGGLGAENVERMKLSLLPRSQLESRLGIKLRHRNLLVIFHPETNNIQKTLADLNKLLNVLESQSEVGCLFVLPNADTYFQAFMTSINEFVASGYNRWVFTSLEPLVYFRFSILLMLSWVIRLVDYKAPFLILRPLYRRQKVDSCESVVDISATEDEILSALEKIKSATFRESVKSVQNPYFKSDTREELQRIYVISTLESNRSLL